MLRNVTAGIQGEVNSQHRILDSMSLNISGISMGLSASAAKFQKVINGPQSKQMIYSAGIAAIALFILYLWLRG